MFPLPTEAFPSNAADLARLMNESVQRIFVTTEPPVTVESAAYPALESLRINLDHAQLRPDPPRPPEVRGESSPALQIDALELRGSGLMLGPARADLRLQARAVHLHQARDREGQVLLLLQRATAGTVEILADKSELEKAIAAVAAREAGKQGVTIENVTLALDQAGPRRVRGEVQLKARKLFFTTVIRIAAQLDLDEALNASLTGLTCQGDGAIGSLACGFLAPHLQKLDGRRFSLLALPLGEIRLRDVRLAAADQIRVEAEFGA